MAALPRPHWPAVLREAPQFRYLWLSRSISATGTGAGRVALVLLAGCEAGQGLIFALIAAVHPALPALLPLVTTAGLLAALMSPAGKSSVPRLVSAGRLPQANALLGLAFNLQLCATRPAPACCARSWAAPWCSWPLPRWITSPWSS